MLKFSKIPCNYMNSKPLDFDVSPAGRVAILIENTQGVCSLIVDGKLWHSWRLPERQPGRQLRWIGNERVGLWPFNDGKNWNGVLSVGPSDQRRLPIRLPSRIFGGSRVIFASYGEDYNLVAKPYELEWNIVASFDFCSNLIFSLAMHLIKTDWPISPLDVLVACVTEQDQLLFVVEDSEDLWLMDAFEGSLVRKPFGRETQEIIALSAIGESFIFVTKEQSGLSISSYTEANGIRCLGQFSDDEPFLSSTAPLTPHRIHGAINGSILAMAGNDLWVIEIK